MLNFNHLSGAIRIALVAGAATMLAGPAFAQDESTAEVERTLDQITVTGTRIQSQTVTASSPVAEIQAEEFQFSGTTRVEDLMNTLPQLSPGFDAFTVNPTTGFPTADLRGLGTARTLVLVNGHRMQPGGIRSEARDLNQIPAALVKRVDVLTGGASAVYGADAMAGVVNFILDNEFEGFSANLGWSAYRHDNDNEYLRPLMDARGFDYPDGDSGFDGDSKNVDLAWGSSFADGRGHAMAWFTYRENDELRQGSRDYSSCALNAGGTSCGGSSTAPNPNFLIFGTRASGAGFGGFAHLNPDGSWAPGVGELYNYAPINHYQRPDERRTFGGSLKVEINPSFRPFIETMFAANNTSVQIAESGTFFVNDPAYTCDNPLIGTLCADLGLDPTAPLDLYIGKRNTEGGPRISNLESNSYRVVMGSEGELVGSWYYNVSFLYGRNSSNEANVNDFLTSRVNDAVALCPPGSFRGCVPYNVWVPGGVTAEAANALSATGMRTGSTALSVFNFYATGELPFTIPSARDPISLVVGTEWRKEEYNVDTDANMATGNFTGLGGPRLPIGGQYEVEELFAEAIVPIVEDAGFLQSLSLDLGFRYSDYETSGDVNTYKLGFNADFGMMRARGGYNRAIRAPLIGNLFADQQIALFGGSDPCAGPTPTQTQAQCALSGVTAAQYGNILPSPASQYNQFIGGNPGLAPEQGDTYTFGLVFTPVRDMSIALDYFDIKIEDRIGTIGAQTILEFCGTTGLALLCDLISRSPTGDLWVGSNPATSGQVRNLTANFGELRWRGVDLTFNYMVDLWGGRLSTSFLGTRMLEQEQAPLAGVSDEATFDCNGRINPSCQAPKWRHSANVRFSRDFWTASLRWRYTGAMDYTLNDGTPGTQDTLLVAMGGELKAWNYLDLSGAFDIGENTTVTLGVNNIADKEPPMVGAVLALNANAPGGYDQLGRYVFTNVNFRF